MGKKKQVTEMKRFYLERKEDVSGISGTGIVAEGVEFTNGKCVISWLTKYTSTSTYDSMKVLVEICGHQGKTLVKYYD